MLAIVLTAVVGRGIFAASPWPLFAGAISGIIAALACSTLLESAVVGFLGTGLGVLLTLAVAAPSIPNTVTVTSPPLVVLSPLQIVMTSTGRSLQAAVLAAAVSAVVHVALRFDRRSARFAAVSGVILIVLGGWVFALTAATQPRTAAWVTGNPGSVATFAQDLRTTPTYSAGLTDETIFLGILQRTASADGYYRASVAVLDESNRARQAGGNALDEATSYRLPTLYWFFALLPRSGIALVYAGLILQASCAVAAYLLARRYLSAPFALVACTAVAMLLASLVSGSLLIFTETWAGALGLIAVALLAYSLDGTRRAVPLHLAAVAVALLAALTRELAVAFLVVGLVVSLSDTDTRRQRLWTLWSVALVAFAGVYAVHAHAALSAFRDAHVQSGLHPGQTLTLAHWLSLDGRGLVATIELGATLMGVAAAGVWEISLLAVLGVLTLPARFPERVLLGLTVGGGMLVLAVAHAGAGSAPGPVIGHWGLLVLPTAFACTPLVFAHLRSARSERPLASGEF